MRAILVDGYKQSDEPAAWLRAEYPRLEVRQFSTAAEALAFVDSSTETRPVDILIAETVLADGCGLCLAAELRARYPGLPVIFLTSHEEHAVRAFAIRATGYLLKPASRERLAAEVDYAMATPALRSTVPARAVTFGNFSLSVDGREVTFRRAKARELLAYLVDRQGNVATRAQVFATLWEEGEYDRSRQKQLDVIVRSLRQTLEEYGIGDLLEVNHGLLRIRPELLDCDLYRFLSGEADAIRRFRGEYMSAYSWATYTEAYLERKANGEP